MIQKKTLKRFSVATFITGFLALPLAYGEIGNDFWSMSLLFTIASALLYLNCSGFTHPLLRIFFTAPIAGAIIISQLFVAFPCGFYPENPGLCMITAPLAIASIMLSIVAATMLLIDIKMNNGFKKWAGFGMFLLSGLVIYLLVILPRVLSNGL